MPAESADYISQLNKEKPTGGESISDGDDHLRVIKKAVHDSFPNISSRVDATPADLNAVSGLVTDVAKLKTDVGDIDADAHGNVAAVYYKSGSMLYKHNVASVTKAPANELGTRVTFQNPLEGESPDHYAFSFTPVASAFGRPIIITVTSVSKESLEFIAVDLIDLNSGQWSLIDGAAVDFSMIVQDMESGQ